MTDYKKYDTSAVTHYWNVRLAKDAEVVEFKDDNKMVRLTFVDSSRLDTDAEMWVEANPVKGNSVSSSYLEKGDVVGLSGKLTFRTYGENNEKFAHNLRNAQVVLSPDLIATLKERGWEPGTETMKGEGGKKKATAKKEEKPAEKRKPGRPPKAKIPVEIDLDDDEAVDE